MGIIKFRYKNVYLNIDFPRHTLQRLQLTVDETMDERNARKTQDTF